MIHLRPVPDDIEFVDTISGVYARGKFHQMSYSRTKVLRILMENSPGYVPSKTLAKKAGISFETLKPCISRVRELMNDLGWIIKNSHSQGYCLIKVRK